MSIPVYERNRRIQLIVEEATKRNYAVWFRSRSRVFMINGQYFKETDGLNKLKELLTQSA